LFAGFFFLLRRSICDIDAAGFTDKVLSRHISGLSFADAPHEILTKTPLKIIKSGSHPWRALAWFW
jgi:hypothetical protein